MATSSKTPDPLDRSARKHGHLAWIVGLACLIGVAGSRPSIGQPPAAKPASSYTGLSLTAALQDLRARGLKLVFTSSLVRPDMLVEHEPTATDPRLILDQLLEPYALEVRNGPGGTLVVVPKTSAATDARSFITGSILSRPNSTPVPGVTVRVVGTNIEVSSDIDGNFVIPNLETGHVTLEIVRRGFVVERRDNIAVTASQPTELAIMLDPAPITEEEVVVTPSRVSLLRQEPVAPVSVTRDELLALPHLGGDFFRALTLLAGASANDISAQFHVRGGRRDETQILIDGQELFDAYHLKDFDNAVSFVAPVTLGSADLTTGGFSVQFGDRMAGVLDMTTIKPSGKSRARFGLGVLSAHAGGSGGFGEDRGSWLAVVRRGNTDLVAKLIGDEDPVYWDAFGKLDYRLNEHNSLRVNALASADRLDFEQIIDEERKLFQTEYNSSYAWLTLQTLLSADLFFESAASVTRIDRDRRGRELEEGVQFSIRDQRDFAVLGFRQNWNFRLSPRQALTWGWQIRDFDTEYDYFGTRAFDNPLAAIRSDSEGTTVFVGEFREEHNSAHISDRIRLFDALTVELGLRYDRHTQTSESRTSPRFNLAYAVGERSVVRLALGRFNQSQRPYELQIEDGEDGFHPVERSEHRVLGYEKLFKGRQGRPGVAFRIEAYQREVANPRPRYENLYEPFNVFPEVEPERVRIAPQRSLAEGLEVSLRGRFGQKFGWWANYAYSSTEDRIDGIWVPRIFDQTNALNLDLDYRINRHWRVNFAWRYHTGWPTTPLSLIEVEEETTDDSGQTTIQTVFAPVLGELNSDRLSTFHRLDLRASRRWRARSSSLEFYVDVQNLYDRENHAGFDFEIDEDTGTIDASREMWAGALISAGIGVEF